MTTDTTTPIAPVIELRDVTAGYGRAVVLRDVSFAVQPGTITAVLGANGAGKTTLLRTCAGLVRPRAGIIEVGGTDVEGMAPNRRARAGFCLIPEGRGIFRSLTVEENLRLQLPPWRRTEKVTAALDAFPILRERYQQTAGTMSGGQQQMLALARAYLAGPSIVALDEVSMGLSPIMVDTVFASMRALADLGLALVIVEQYVHRALELADQVVLLDRGTTVFVGPRGDVDESALLRSYLGVEDTIADVTNLSSRSVHFGGLERRGLVGQLSQGDDENVKNC